jgi:hypothetical protein
MNETQSTVEFGGEWLTVSQAAAWLEISERQARRDAAKLSPHDRREAEHGTDEAGHMTGARPARVRLEAMKALRESAALRSKQFKTTPDTMPDTRPAHAGHMAGHMAGHEPDTSEAAQAVQLARIEGYLAANMASAVESAVRAATSPLMAQLETMNQTNEKLLREIEETRGEVAAMRADKDSDCAQLAKLEELISILESPKPEAMSWDKLGQENATRENALQTPIMGATGKVSGGVGNVTQRGIKAKRRAFWKLIFGIR